MRCVLVISFACALQGAACMVSPTEEQIVGPRHGFRGYVPIAGATVKLGASRTQSGSYAGFATTYADDEAAIYPWDTPMYAWSISGSVPSRYWAKSEGGGASVWIKAWIEKVDPETYERTQRDVVSLAEDWQSCYFRVDTLAEFVAQCAGRTSPRIRLYSRDYCPPSQGPRRFETALAVTESTGAYELTTRVHGPVASARVTVNGHTVGCTRTADGDGWRLRCAGDITALGFADVCAYRQWRASRPAVEWEVRYTDARQRADKFPACSRRTVEASISYMPLDAACRACDMLDPGTCAAGEACYITSGTTLTECLPAGTGAAGDGCSEPSDCAPGHACLGIGTQACVKLCDFSLGSADCPGDLRCVVYAHNPPGTGTCTP